jgi:hypothetical protein
MAEGRESTITLKLSKPEALALLKAAATGVAVIDALHLIPNSGLIEAVVRKPRAAT